MTQITSQVVILAHPNDRVGQALHKELSPLVFNISQIYESITEEELLNIRYGPQTWIILDASTIHKTTDTLDQIFSTSSNIRIVLMGGINRMDQLLKAAKYRIDLYVDKILGPKRISAKLKQFLEKQIPSNSYFQKDSGSTTSAIKYDSKFMANLSAESQSILEQIHSHKNTLRWWIDAEVEAEALLVAKEIANVTGHSPDRVSLNPQDQDSLKSRETCIFTESPKYIIPENSEALVIYAGNQELVKMTGFTQVDGQRINLTSLSRRTLDKADYINRLLPDLIRVNGKFGLDQLPNLTDTLKVLSNNKINSLSGLWINMQALVGSNDPCPWNEDRIHTQVHLLEPLIQKNYKEKLKRALSVGNGQTLEDTSIDQITNLDFIELHSRNASLV